MIPTKEDFELKLSELLVDAENKELDFVDIVSGDLHRVIGGYPVEDGNHRMPICCQVMKDQMVDEDQILHSPPKGQGATLKIRYKLPRQ